MKSTTAIPERIMREAERVYGEIGTPPILWLPIARALLAAEERGRKEERERNAEIAERWLNPILRGHVVAAIMQKENGE